jgi:hypothetical protein
MQCNSITKGTIETLPKMLDKIQDIRVQGKQRKGHKKRQTIDISVSFSRLRGLEMRTHEGLYLSASRCKADQHGPNNL